MENISQWREELKSLHHQAETALLIVDMMSGMLVYYVVLVCHITLSRVSVLECVQLIIEDAKKKMDEQCQQDFVTQKPHQCSYCQKTFSFNCYLQRHILTPSGEKSYQCDYCQKRFTQQSNLQ